MVMTSCYHVHDEWVRLDDFSSLDPAKSFIPYSVSIDGIQAENQLNTRLNRIEAECTDTLIDDVMRTSSFNSVGLAKGLFSNWHSDQSRSYCGSYMSVDENGAPIRLSGRIVVPLNGKVKRIMVVSHYTIGANYEAPSESFPLEGIFAARGIAVIVPDYIGYGMTADRIHPYLCSRLTAQNVADMYFASLPFLQHIDCMPEYDDILLFGYSQGGATTVAVTQYLENSNKAKIRLVMAGGGPYDICVTYDKLIDNDYTDYPCAIPLIIQGMDVGHQLDLDYSQFFLPNTLEHMDDWINSKRYAMAEITELMGTKKLSDIMTPEACNKTSDGMTLLYLAMLGNSVANSFVPHSPVYLFHSMDDNVVPFENAEQLLELVQHYDCNVETNFGHYGSHVKGYLRFLYTAIQLLYEHGEIDRKF